MASPFDSKSIDSAVASNPDLTAPPTIQQPIQKSQGLGKGLMGAMLGGDLADALSTNLGHTQREANPLLPNPGIGNFAGIMGAGLVKALLLNKLAHSHPTLAKTLAGGSIGVSGYDTANNITSRHGKYLWPFGSM